MRTTAPFPLIPCHRCQACIISLSASAQALPNKRVLVISHENVTACMYLGNEKSMLITNCLFRMGGAAVLMSNRWGLLLPLLPGLGCPTCHSPHLCTPTDVCLDCCHVSLQHPVEGSSVHHCHRINETHAHNTIHSASPLLLLVS